MSEKGEPVVRIGMLVYNDGRYLDEAINSLLSQSYTDFRLVISDDSSTDDSGEIARKWAERDERVEYVRNEFRLGLAENSRTVFRQCRPCDYFAWAAGHDRYHKKWLERMIDALQKNGEAVLAYPVERRIDEGGEPLDTAPTCFSTVGLDFAEGVRKVITHGSGFGTMIYGLFRSTALWRAGVFPATLLPDALLVTKVAALGVIVQVDELLWDRRFGPRHKEGIDFIARQKRTVFASTPLYAHFPWPWQHAGSMALEVFCGGGAGRWLSLRGLVWFIGRRWRQFVPHTRLWLSNIGWLRKLFRILFPRGGRSGSL